MVNLNPSAPTFTLGVKFPGVADSSKAVKSDCPATSFAADGDFSPLNSVMKDHPPVPPNTPEVTQVDAVEHGVSKHLATRLGEGWKTTFPTSAASGPKSKHLDVPLHKDRSFIPGHRTRSPSLPGLLPSDAARGNARSPRDLPAFFQRLTTSSQVNGVLLNQKGDTSFDPFEDGISCSPTTEQFTFAPAHHPQRLPAFGHPSSPVAPMFSYPAHGDNAHDIMTACDIGEGRNGM